MKVIKRDGKTVDFDPSKIVIAIEKANKVLMPALFVLLLGLYALVVVALKGNNKK